MGLKWHGAHLSAFQAKTRRGVLSADGSGWPQIGKRKARHLIMVSVS